MPVRNKECMYVMSSKPLLRLSVGCELDWTGPWAWACVLAWVRAVIWRSLSTMIWRARSPFFFISDKSCFYAHTYMHLRSYNLTLLTRIHTYIHSYLFLVCFIQAALQNFQLCGQLRRIFIRLHTYIYTYIHTRLISFTLTYTHLFTNVNKNSSMHVHVYLIGLSLLKGGNFCCPDLIHFN